ncbi:hypothetical protein AYI70_g9150 [Smittium culicis]|uniref:Jacalin-type lectin domain-containing protein n=1 Tax=Smittium culicis TaxID=133412 RepID=A0A1R1XCP7_9FUNG|nr:hypothetical protein AYI70_g9150 [Smittium culicis]
MYIKQTSILIALIFKSLEVQGSILLPLNKNIQNNVNAGSYNLLDSDLEINQIPQAKTSNSGGDIGKRGPAYPINPKSRKSKWHNVSGICDLGDTQKIGFYATAANDLRLVVSDQPNFTGNYTEYIFGSNGGIGKENPSGIYNNRSSGAFTSSGKSSKLEINTYNLLFIYRDRFGFEGLGMGNYDVDPRSAKFLVTNKRKGRIFQGGYIMFYSPYNNFRIKYVDVKCSSNNLVNVMKKLPNIIKPQSPNEKISPGPVHNTVVRPIFKIPMKIAKKIKKDRASGKINMIKKIKIGPSGVLIKRDIPKTLISSSSQTNTVNGQIQNVATIKRVASYKLQPEIYLNTRTTHPTITTGLISKPLNNLSTPRANENLNQNKLSYATKKIVAGKSTAKSSIIVVPTPVGIRGEKRIPKSNVAPISSSKPLIIKKKLKITTNLLKPTSTIATILAKRRVKSTKITGLEDNDSEKTTQKNPLPSRRIKGVNAMENKPNTSKSLNPNRSIVGVVKTQLLAISSSKLVNINPSARLKYTTPTSVAEATYIAKIPRTQYLTPVQKQNIGDPYQEYANLITTDTLKTTRKHGAIRSIDPDQTILKSETNLKRVPVSSRKLNLQEKLLPRPIQIKPFRAIIHTRSIMPLVSISSNPGTKAEYLNTIISKTTITSPESKRHLDRIVNDNKKIKRVYSTPTVYSTSTQKQRKVFTGIPASTKYEYASSESPIALKNRMVDGNSPQVTNGTMVKTPTSELKGNVCKCIKNNFSKIKKCFNNCKCKTSGFFSGVLTNIRSFFWKVIQVVGNFASSVGNKVKSIGDYVGKKIFSKDKQTENSRIPNAQTTLADATSTKTLHLTPTKTTRVYNKRMAASLTVSNGGVIKVKIPSSLTTKVIKKGLRFVTIVLEV